MFFWGGVLVSGIKVFVCVDTDNYRQFVTCYSLVLLMGRSAFRYDPYTSILLLTVVRCFVTLVCVVLIFVHGQYLYAMLLAIVDMPCLLLPGP